MKRNANYYPKVQNWDVTKSVLTQLDIQAKERDKNQCVKCQKKTGLEAHHIIPGIEELDNLITLCHSCHKKEHNMAGCFEQGESKDKIRMKTAFKKGEVREINKTHYYNRYESKWIRIEKNQIPALPNLNR